MRRKESAAPSKPSNRLKTRQGATALAKMTTTSVTTTSSKPPLLPTSVSASRNAASNSGHVGEGSSSRSNNKVHIASSRTQFGATSNAEAKSSTVSATVPLDEEALAEKFDRSLRISSPSQRGVRKGAAVVDGQRQLASQALADLKLSLQKLADAVQLGWKASSPTKAISRKSLDNALSIARGCIKRLRVSTVARSIDVEKSASQIVGRVILLELFKESLALLTESRPHVLELVHPLISQREETMDEDISRETGVGLSLPPPDSESVVRDDDLLSLVAAYQLHVLQTCIPLATDDVAESILANGNLLSWSPLLYQHLSESQCSALFTSAFQTVAKCGSSLSPWSLFRIRAWGLKCLLMSPTLKEDPFWDQVGKYSASYVRVVGDDARQPVAVLIDELFIQASERKDASRFFQGKGFVGICEYRLKFAKLAKNRSEIERVKVMLAKAGKNIERDSRQENTQSVDLKIVQLYAVITEYISILESLHSNPQADFSMLRLASLTITECTQLVTQGAISTESIRKINVGLNQLRHSCTRLLTLQLQHDLDDDKSVDGSSRPGTPVAQRVGSRGTPECTYLVASSKLLSAVTAHLANSQVSPAMEHGPACVDSLICLARIELARPGNHLKAIREFLDEAATVARKLTSDSGVRAGTVLRTISSAFWTVAITLFDRDQHAATIPFIAQSCDLAQELQDFRMSDQEDQEAVRASQLSIRDLLPKRWELLGFCQLRTGDRKLAYEAFRHGVLSSRHFLPRIAELSCRVLPSELFSSDPGTRALESLLERFTMFTTHDLLEPSSTPLFHIFSEASDVVTSEEKEALGILMELQLLLLRNSVGCRSSDSQKARKKIMESCLLVYTQEYPIRRVRVLMDLLVFHFNDDIVDAIEVRTQLQELLQFNARSSGVLNMNEILKRYERTHDRSLASFVPQYIATLAALSALIVHRSGNMEASLDDIRSHASSSMAIFRDHVLPRPFAEGQDVYSVLQDAQNKPEKLRTARGSKGKMVGVPRKVKKANAASPAPVKVLSNITKQLPGQFHDAEFVDSQLDLLAQVLGSIGLVIAKLEVLHVRFGLTMFPGSPIGGRVRVLVDLAREYCRLEQFQRATSIYATAFSILGDSVGVVTKETQAEVFLQYAAHVASRGDAEQALVGYNKASVVTEVIEAEVPSSGPSRANFRLASLIRAAFASQAFSSIQISRDNVTAGINGLLQSLRLWTRATELLTRLHEASISASDVSLSPNPFEVSEPPTSNLKSQSGKLNAMQWKAAEYMADVQLTLGRIYSARGSLREAEYFLDKALALAQSAGALRVILRVKLDLGEMKLLSSGQEVGGRLLSEVDLMAENSVSLEKMDLQRVFGDFNVRADESESAARFFEAAINVFEYLTTEFEAIESQGHASDKNIFQSPSSEGSDRQDLVPSTLALILRQQIWLLRDTPGDGSDYVKLLDRFLALPRGADEKANQGVEHLLMGKLTLEEVYARFRTDIVLSSLPESTIAVPMGMTGGDITTPPTVTRELLTALSTTEKFFWACLESNQATGSLLQIREAVKYLALIRTYQTSLGVKVKNGSTVTAMLLDLGVAPTLHHELIDCIDLKFASSRQDDLQWQRMSVTGSPLKISATTMRRKALLFADSDDSDLEDPQNSSMQRYWWEIQERYRSQSWDPVSLTATQVDLIPPHWIVVGINVTHDRSTLIVTRQRAHEAPLIFHLPIDRHDRHANTNEIEFSYESAMEELNTIIKASNDTARNAKNVQEKEHRRSWWAERATLDQRLRAFVENVEFCWLGAFKIAFCEPCELPPNVLASFRSRLESVLRRNGCIHDKKSRNHLHLDDSILKCFSSLSPKCRDEELEDLAYFVLDLFQLHGAQVASSEIDVDQLIIDLRTLLEEHVQALAKYDVKPPKDHHLFIVLDKELQSIPWESIPILRGRSVSRIPTISFLVDRVHLARHLKGLPTSSLGSVDHPIVDRAMVNPKNTFFILNPSGDLKSTEERFEGWLKKMEKVGWEGIIGRIPTEVELVRALTSYDLVIYFGHGGAEQYIRSHKIRNLPRCASIMLWGCSSGVLKDMGEFDRVGNPYHYMVAGCPSLIANLWDVTDKDIDRFSDSVFQKLGLDVRKVRDWVPTSDPSVGPRKGGKYHKPDGNGGGYAVGTSVVEAVATSRDICKLQYLTGAAPVVYGIPYYL